MNKVLYLFKKYRLILIPLLIIWILFILFLITSDNSISFKNNILEEEYYSEWEKFHDINSDYVGHIVFESNIINLPVLKANDNDYYLRKNIYKKSDIKGTPFMDYRCSLDDQNIIIYGHYIKKGSKEMFSPLEKLVDSRENDKVSLKLRSSTRQYELVSVMIVNEEDGNIYPFLYQNYTQENINEFNEYLIINSTYYSNEPLTLNDSILTLVTCTDSMNEYREIIVFKEKIRFY